MLTLIIQRDNLQKLKTKNQGIIWNSIPSHTQNCKTIKTFSTHVKKLYKILYCTYLPLDDVTNKLR